MNEVLIPTAELRDDDKWYHVVHLQRQTPSGATITTEIADCTTPHDEPTPFETCPVASRWAIIRAPA